MTGTAERPTTDGALFRYRVMANVVGVLLILLVIGVVIDSQPIKAVVGVIHGVFGYPLLLISVFDLWRRRRFPFLAVVLVGLAGTIPLLSFVAEHQVTARVRDGRF